jgi:hypothetical protein
MKFKLRVLAFFAIAAMSASGRTTTLGGRGLVSAIEKPDAQNLFVRGC